MKEIRVCQRCGEVIPLGDRKCPKCGRLSVDSQTDRLWAQPVIAPAQDAPEPPDHQTKSDSSSKTATEDEKGDTSSGSATTDSHFSIAPIYDPPPPKESQEEVPREKGPSICNCMVFLIIIGWFFTIISLV